MTTHLNDSELRLEARRAVQRQDRATLLSVLSEKLPAFIGRAERRVVVYALSAARQELVDRYPCQDCGAVAGRECKPDYGCSDSSRR